MIKILLFLTISLATVLAQPPKDLQLFLLIGQSNMAGRGVLEARDKEPAAHIYMLTKELEWKPAMDPLHFDKPDIAGVGLGRSFARELLKSNPAASIGLIPAAFGGTSLEEWKPGGRLYNDAIARTRAAMKAGKLICPFNSLFRHLIGHRETNGRGTTRDPGGVVDAGKPTPASAGIDGRSIFGMRGAGGGLHFPARTDARIGVTRFI